MEDQFKKGSLVRISGFSGRGEVVSGPNKKGELKIAFGGIEVNARPEQLRAVEGNTASSDSKTSAPARSRSKKLHTIKIDLHGKTAAQAKIALITALDRAIVDDVSCLEIVHGLGTGKVKQLVYDFLSGSRHIRSFRTPDHNPGVTLAYLD
jgi:DNA mismatch repair protein MutS2